MTVWARDMHVVQSVIDCLAQRRSGVSLEAIYGSARGKPRVVFARHFGLYLLHAHLGGSISATAMVAGRDRRMVAYALGRIEDRRESDPAFDRLMDLCVAEVSRRVADAVRHLDLRLQPLPGECSAARPRPVPALAAHDNPLSPP